MQPLLTPLPHGLAVRIAGSHPAGPGSTPGGGTQIFCFWMVNLDFDNDVLTSALHCIIEVDRFIHRNSICGLQICHSIYVQQIMEVFTDFHQ